MAVDLHVGNLLENEGIRIGQRREINSDAVTTKASAPSMGGSEAGVSLQNGVNLKQGGPPQ